MANAPGGNNAGGANQFQGFNLEAPYGDAKKNFELLRQAPISGAPVSGRALDTPERQRSARRRGTSGAASPAGSASAPATTVLPQLPIPYEKQIALQWQQAAAIPGASDLVKEIAQRAQEQAASI